jgi:DNA recombination protein Rad52
MAFTDSQVRQLKAKLEPRYIKTRSANGVNLSYVEGWHAIAEANRIFGFDAWDRRTVSTTCVWSGQSAQIHAAAYTARVRVSVRAGDVVIVREGSGMGEGRASTPGQAHELALKGAETDATKRALATFGNPFGLALYDREQAGVRKARASSAQTGPWPLHSSAGEQEASFEQPSEFADALRKALSDANDIELLFAVWEQNVDTVRALNKQLKQDHLPKSGVAPQLVAHLKRCAIALVKPHAAGNEETLSQAQNGYIRPKVDKSVLTLSEPKRHRSKEHLKYVAQQPCLICGRSPTHAHHVRFAQPKGLALKVSDEFTVPLCVIHHSENHTTGDERKWWQKYNVEPLATARRLWEETCKHAPADPGVTAIAALSTSAAKC